MYYDLLFGGLLGMVGSRTNGNVTPLLLAFAQGAVVYVMTKSLDAPTVISIALALTASEVIRVIKEMVKKWLSSVSLRR